MGTYAPSAGTIYPRLARLEAEGLVTSDVDAGRKVFRLTDAGERGTGPSGRRALRELEEDIAQSVSARARDVREDVHTRGATRAESCAARPENCAGRLDTARRDGSTDREGVADD